MSRTGTSTPKPDFPWNQPDFEDEGRHTPPRKRALDTKQLPSLPSPDSPPPQLPRLAMGSTPADYVPTPLTPTQHSNYSPSPTSAYPNGRDRTFAGPAPRTPKNVNFLPPMDFSPLNSPEMPHQHLPHGQPTPPQSVSPGELKRPRKVSRVRNVSNASLTSPVSPHEGGLRRRSVVRNLSSAGLPSPPESPGHQEPQNPFSEAQASGNAYYEKRGLGGVHEEEDEYEDFVPEQEQDGENPFGDPILGRGKTIRGYGQYQRKQSEEQQQKKKGGVEDYSQQGKGDPFKDPRETERQPYLEDVEDGESLHPPTDSYAARKYEEARRAYEEQQQREQFEANQGQAEGQQYQEGGYEQQYDPSQQQQQGDPDQQHFDPNHQQFDPSQQQYQNSADEDYYAQYEYTDEHGNIGAAPPAHADEHVQFANDQGQVDYEEQYTDEPRWSPYPHSGPLIDRVLDRIQMTEFTRVDKEILTAFVRDAVDSERAAMFLHEMAAERRSDMAGFGRVLIAWKEIALSFWRSGANAPGLPKQIKELVFRRDGSRCCISRTKKGWFTPNVDVSYIVPPSFFDGKRVGTADGELIDGYKILDAFVTSKNLARLRTLVESAGYENMWTLSHEAQEAFQKGLIHLLPGLKTTWDEEKGGGGEMVNSADENGHWRRYRVSLCPLNNPRITAEAGLVKNMDTIYLETQSPQNMPLPHPELLQFQFRLATTLRWIAIEEKMLLKEWTGTSRKVTSSSFFPRLIRRLIQHLTPAVAESLYKRALSFSRRFYPSDNPHIQRLPFGFYLKHGPHILPSEARALQFLEQEAPHVPAPRVVDMLEDDSLTYYLLTTRCAGDRLSKVFHLLGPEELKTLIEDLKEFISALRSIPLETEHAIYDPYPAAEDEALDYQIPKDACGALHISDEFNEFWSASLCEKGKAAVANANRRTGAPGAGRNYYTHGALGMDNVLVVNGRLAGVTGWGEAGWMPEHWEYTRAMCKVKGRREWEWMWDEVFEGVYAEDLRTEKVVFDMCSPFNSL